MRVAVKEQKSYMVSAAVFTALNILFGVLAYPLIDMLAVGLTVF